MPSLPGNGSLVLVRIDKCHVVHGLHRQSSVFMHPRYVDPGALNGADVRLSSWGQEKHLQCRPQQKSSNDSRDVMFAHLQSPIRCPCTLRTTRSNLKCVKSHRRTVTYRTSKLPNSVVRSNLGTAMKTLIICTALMFGGFGAIGSMIAFSSAP